MRADLVAVVDVAGPAVERRFFAASVLALLLAVVGLVSRDVAEDVVVGRVVVVRAVAVLLLTVLVGLLAAAVVELAVDSLEVLSLPGELAAAVPGATEVRRSAEVAGFLVSSSDADTLGRDRWVAVEEAVVGRRMVDGTGGRVGGLVRPLARVVLVVAVVGLVPGAAGRRTLPVAVAVFFTGAVAVAAASLAGASTAGSSAAGAGAGEGELAWTGTSSC